MLCSQNDVRHTLFKLLRTSLGGTYCSYSLWDIILWIFEQQPKGQEEELVLLSCCFFRELSTSWVTLSLGVLLLGLSCGWTSAQWSDLFCNQSKSAKEKMMLLLLSSQGVISCFFRTALQYDASTVLPQVVSARRKENARNLARIKKIERTKYWTQAQRN